MKLVDDERTGPAERRVASYRYFIDVLRRKGGGCVFDRASGVYDPVRTGPAERRVASYRRHVDRAALDASSPLVQPDLIAAYLAEDGLIRLDQVVAALEAVGDDEIETYREGSVDENAAVQACIQALRALPAAQPTSHVCTTEHCDDSVCGPTSDGKADRCDCGKTMEACAATEDCSGQSMPATREGEERDVTLDFEVLLDNFEGLVAACQDNHCGARMARLRQGHHEVMEAYRQARSSREGGK